MRAESLRGFLIGAKEAADLVFEIREEVRDYRRAHGRRGASVPITVVGNPQVLEIDTVGLQHLCNGFLAGTLTSWDVHFICDAVSLVDARFASERVREIVEELANPELRLKELSSEDVSRIRDELVT